MCREAPPPQRVFFTSSASVKSNGRPNACKLHLCRSPKSPSSIPQDGRLAETCTAVWKTPYTVKPFGNFAPCRSKSRLILLQESVLAVPEAKGEGPPGCEDSVWNWRKWTLRGKGLPAPCARILNLLKCDWRVFFGAVEYVCRSFR